MSKPAPRPGTEAAKQAKPAEWSRRPERSLAWVLRLMRWIALTAGRRLARLLLPPIALYFLLANRPARQASQAYLTRALGHRATWRRQFKHFHTFSATVLDRVYLLQPNCKDISLRTCRIELVEQRLANGQGVFMVGAHLGSFEALRAMGGLQGARVAMLMYEDNARLINTTLAAIAPELPFTIIGLGQLGAMLRLRDWLAQGGIAGLLADRSLPTESGRGHTHWLPFLGQPAAFSDGPFRLAALLRQPVVFMAGIYRGGNEYELQSELLADFSSETAHHPVTTDALVIQALHAYVQRLETLCRETPYNWFNFYDFWAGDANAASAGTR
jgi:predicted LPLAT superfamily acyltransferase